MRLGTVDEDEARRVVGALDGERLVVEEVVPFDAEISVVVARGLDGEVAHHGVMENVHVNRILDTTVTPPLSVPPAVASAAPDLATAIARYLDLVGVLCVEMFVTGEELIVNEIAPRPHNSGHCTIEAAPTSQFARQLRAICGLPLGDGACRPAAMVQLLGDLWGDGAAPPPDWPAALADPGVQLHLYGKEEVRPGRKMGHITCTDTSAERALERALAARRRLGAPAMIPGADRDSPREQCGVIGVYSTDREVARIAFFGLFALQHRGQEAAGIATYDGRFAHVHKGEGLVGSGIQRRRPLRSEGWRRHRPHPLQHHRWIDPAQCPAPGHRDHRRARWRWRTTATS